MNKLINKNLIFGFGILAIMFLFSPINKAFAREYFVMTGNSIIWDDTENYSNSSNDLSNSASFNNTVSPVAPTASYGTTTKPTSSTTSTTKKPTTTATKVTTTTKSTSTTSGNDADSLAANALFGSNGFLPSGILQWLIFAILILLAVILWRKLWVSEEQKNAPLKHA